MSGCCLDTRGKYDHFAEGVNLGIFGFGRVFGGFEDIIYQAKS